MGELPSWSDTDDSLESMSDPDEGDIPDDMPDDKDSGMGVGVGDASTREDEEEEEEDDFFPAGEGLVGDRLS